MPRAVISSLLRKYAIDAYVPPVGLILLSVLIDLLLNHIIREPH